MISPQSQELTYGEGAVAAFSKGAINHPSLLASACVLFDSVTVVRPIDVLGECWPLRGTAWRYGFYPNPEADDFWRAVEPLVDKGVLRSFRTQIDVSGVQTLRNPPDKVPFAPDAFDFDSDGVTQRCLFAVGFTEYCRYIGANGLPLVLSGTELHDVPSTGRLSPIVEISRLSHDSRRILSGCVPQIEVAGHHADELVSHIDDIRDELTERSAFVSMIGKLSTILAESGSSEDYAMAVNEVSSSFVDTWEAYTSRLSTLASGVSLPVKFVPLSEVLVTLDRIACGKHLLGVLNDPLAEETQKRMIAYV